ncbi:MAG: hypothetical protein ACW96U_13915 [Candidatus Heimdallarchaeaceae archaeon]|jgi:Na+/H+ antiporter NhaD/arsenite permease-like protein
METSSLIQIILFGILIGISILLLIINIVVRIITKRNESKQEERILKRNEYLLLGSSVTMLIGIVGLLVTLSNIWLGYPDFHDLVELEFIDIMSIASWIALFWGSIFMKLGYRKTKVRLKRHDESENEFELSVFGSSIILLALVLLIITSILFFLSEPPVGY